MRKSAQKNPLIFDPIYGFIPLTTVEWEIIHSPFYQRLRWIKQLGFSCYVFPGAEHSRFGHSIGVLNNAHHILNSCRLAVPDENLFNTKSLGKADLFHKSIRLAALMHDLGTFPFSHTTEGAYIRYGETTKGSNPKTRVDDHEHLGSFIIKNTDYPGGITSILKKHGFDPDKISKLVKGIDPSLLANQILHSEIDCDRMDYLLRDAYYTGLNYGSYDRDYLLYHFEVEKVGKDDVLCIKHNALHCVEDFLMSRFAWYSQVVRSPRGARFDAIAERITQHMLEKGMILKYSELLSMIEKRPEEFYMFNDVYFMGLVHKYYINGDFDKFPDIKDLANMLLFEKPPETIKIKEFKQKLLNQDEAQENLRLKKIAEQKIKEMENFLKKKGEPKDWLINDLPSKDIVFVKSYKRVVKENNRQNVLLTRDAAKILMEDGKIKLLAEVENSVISRLQNVFNYVPNVYCSKTAYQLLKSNKFL